MSINSDEIKKIARLSRIKILKENIGNYTNDINKILAFVEQLSEVETDTVEPMTGTMGAYQRLREDVINDGGKPEELIKNAPDETMNFFTVPKVVE